MEMVRVSRGEKEFPPDSISALLLSFIDKSA
jgi:hypothetical protein